MNAVSITGRLVRNAFLNGSGDKRAMKFSIAAPTGYDPRKKTEIVEFVPCVFFNPAEKLQEIICSEGQGKLIELQGNVTTSSFEKNGTKVWATEVRVNPSSFQLLPIGKKGKDDISTELISEQIPFSRRENGYKTLPSFSNNRN